MKYTEQHNLNAWQRFKAKIRCCKAIFSSQSHLLITIDNGQITEIKYFQLADKGAITAMQLASQQIERMCGPLQEANDILK